MRDAHPGAVPVPPSADASPAGAPPADRPDALPPGSAGVLPSAPLPVPRRGARRWLPWLALLALLGVAQTLLVVLTLNFEATRAQDEADRVAGDAAVELRRAVGASLQSVQSLLWNNPSPMQWRADASEMLRQRRELVRIERRDEQRALADAVDGPFRDSLFAPAARDRLGPEGEAACAAARRSAAPVVSTSYFVPGVRGDGMEVVELCVPAQREGRSDGFVVAVLPLGLLLEAAVPADAARRHELTFVEPDGARLARAGASRGAGVYQADRVVDLPGFALVLRVDSVYGRPSLIPNLATALVLGLSLALFALVLLLARDVRRRAQAERALAEALAFRKAMEDSLSTGLRARDLSGRITYVNPAFCAMVGFGASELLGRERPPYWPPEHADAYARRQAQRLAPMDSGGPREVRPQSRPDAPEGFESVFVRRDGERFPVMIYEAPLVDGESHHTGWMSAVVDLSAQRRIEDLSRQQQERLQASARLATVGEMASLLSHELNQPLAAIVSYANGSMNLLDQPDVQTPVLLRQAAARIAEQAERAGRVIKSVNAFVRRRDQAREPVSVDGLIEAVLPLVRLQARKCGARIDLQFEPGLPRVHCDRTMIEQVLLNLARNGLQAMEAAWPPDARVLTLRACSTAGRRVQIEVADAGTGIPPEVAARLFTPFFTTRPEGMGLGLSLCRTVVEQHGGVLEFDSPAGAGTVFRFTLPADVRPVSARRGADGLIDTPRP